MSSGAHERFYTAVSLADAVAALAERGRAGTPFAGGTWIMRAPLRGGRHDRSYVAISGIEALRTIALDEKALRIGACVPHADLAARLARHREFRGLAQAAGNSANPAVRNVATVGGNLCMTEFPAADLVPALLCLDAQVELQTGGERARLPLQDFLAIRSDLQPGSLVTQVIVPRSRRRSSHIRLTLRKAGDYPVAIVSISLDLLADGRAGKPRVALGSVEAVASRWRALEQKLDGQALDPAAVAAAAENCLGSLQGRDGVESPGWYRVKVLPALVRRALDAIRQEP